jgi:hypothetical protein
LIIDRVAYNWEVIATCLEFETHHIERIEKDNHYKCREACHAMLSEWLDGRRHEPRTWPWGTIVKALNKANFGEVAQKLNTIVTEKF